MRKVFSSGWLKAYRQPETRAPYGVLANKLGNVILPAEKVNYWLQSY